MRRNVLLPGVLGIVLFCVLVQGCRARTRATSDEAAPAVTESQPARMATFETSRSTSVFDLAGQPRLTVENQFGDVEVVPGGPEARVDSVVYALGTDLADARRRGSTLAANEEPDPEAGLKITVEREQIDSDVRADLVVRAPREIALQVCVSAGQVSVMGMEGPIEVLGASGRTSLTDMKGHVTVENTSGSVRVADARDGLCARTSSGDIVLERIQGSVLARTLSGAISLSDIRSEKITVSTGSGNIDIRLGTPFAGRMHARTDSGDIAIALPRNSNCRVKTATRLGEVSCSLPLRAKSGQGRNISGRLGGGEGVIDLGTGSGDIKLVGAD